MAQISHLRHRLLQEDDTSSSGFRPLHDTDDMWILIASIGIGLSLIFLTYRLSIDCFMVESGHGIKRSTVSARIEEQKKERAEKQRREAMERAKHEKKAAAHKRLMKGKKKKKKGKRRKRPAPEQYGNRQRAPSKSSEDFSADSNTPLRRRVSHRSEDSTNDRPGRGRSAEPNRTTNSRSNSAARKRSNSAARKAKLRSRSAEPNRNRNNVDSPRVHRIRRPSANELEYDDDSDDSSEYVTGPPAPQRPAAPQKQKKTLPKEKSPYARPEPKPAKQTSKKAKAIRRFNDSESESSIEPSSDDSSHEEMPPRKSPAKQTSNKAKVIATRRSNDSESESSIEPSSDDSSYEEMPPRQSPAKQTSNKAKVIATRRFNDSESESSIEPSSDDSSYEEMPPRKSPARKIKEQQGLINGNRQGGPKNQKKVAVKGFLGGGH